MQDFSLAFGRVTRSTMATNPDLRLQVTDLLTRAYYNIHAASFTNADAGWVSSITGAAMQLAFDPRVQALSQREVVALFENIIIISEEHTREARRHAAMATNAFYLKETALDALSAMRPGGFTQARTSITSHKAHTGRLDVEKPGTPIL